MAAVSAFNVYQQETGIDGALERTSPYAYKEIIAETSNTADPSNTVVITLAKYGITTFKTVRIWEHSTENSVITVGTGTTAVATGVLTVTLGGQDNMKKVVLIGGI